MIKDQTHFEAPIILFGNGEIPTHEIPLFHLKNAKTILCADGGAIQLAQLGFYPDIILGDLDSYKQSQNPVEIIQLKDQSKTDLQKCLDWCIENGISKLSLIGFSGKEDDHWVSTIWALACYYEKIELTYYSNYSKIRCVNGIQKFDSMAGQIISIIPTKEKIKISVSGLKYIIKESELLPPSFGIRNKALGDIFTIHSSGPVWLFQNYNT